MKDRIPEIVKESYRKLPHLPDGRVDYTNAEKAPTLVTFLKYKDEILLLKRSEKVATHKGRWGVVAGYLDELKPVIEKSLEEVEEETGITEDQIVSIDEGKVYKFDEGNTTYISHPLLMELNNKADINLSWEHKDYKWVSIENVDNFLPSYALKELKTILNRK